MPRCFLHEIFTFFVFIWTKQVKKYICHTLVKNYILSGENIFWVKGNTYYVDCRVDPPPPVYTVDMDNGHGIDMNIPIVEVRIVVNKIVFNLVQWLH